MKYFKFLCSFLRRQKIDFENTKRTCDVKVGKWKKAAKVCHHVFLDAWPPPSPDTAKIIGHPWT
jgi:hypothetical protein